MICNYFLLIKETFLKMFFFLFRLKQVSDKLNRFGSTVPSPLGNLRIPVKTIVVGPTHFALLLEDGHICRVNFSIITDRLDLTKKDPNKK